MSSNYWIFLSLTTLLLIFLSYSTFATARLLRGWRPDRNLLLMPAENLLRIGLIGVVLLLGGQSGLGYQQLGWDLSHVGQQVGVGLGCGLLLAMVFYFSTQWLLRLGGERYYSAVIIHAITPRNQRELYGVLLAMMPVVLLEELLFRSLLIGGLHQLFPTTFLVIGWGIFFGMLHLPQGAWGVAGAGIAGIILGALFVSTGTIVAPVVAHYITNSVQLIQAMRLGYGERERRQEP